EEISLDLPEPIDTDAKPENIPLDIVYEDNDLIVINKPQGMVVHPAPGHYSGTLVNALLYHCKGNLSDINGVIRPGIIHRIDMDTSGLMIAVKNNETHTIMAKMIAEHEVVRNYRCCVYGVVDSDKGTINAPIGRAKNDRRKMTVTEDGKPSITHFEVVERFRKATDMLCKLETGRTHQIRSHMTFIGHPCLGDPLYAPKRDNYGLKGQALHSTSLAFIHPRTEEPMTFSVDVPPYYHSLIDTLRKDC
ncbi:MAG TPA: RluA family pseudouridine synthase, partial [Bacillota bacterium]|nr:RluA family pseudouridine synthase [Bacillota bacterium]